MTYQSTSDPGQPGEQEARELLASRLRFGRCELRLHSREIVLGGQVQAARGRVFDLIACLIRQRPRVVSQRELRRALWPDRTVSSSLLARVVMEARRAIGDSADEPQFIVTIHGVGYRFAGVLHDELQTGQELPADAGAGVIEVRKLIARARQSAFEGQLDRAQVFAEMALAQADVVRSNAERVKALVICSTVAMRRSSAPAAARLAAQALQIAKGEGSAQLIAQARLASGAVHLFAGDLDIATRHFQESREALSVPGHEADLQRCLSFLGLALRNAGDIETALQMCRRNIQLARRHDVTDFLMTDLMNEVLYLVLLGDRHAAQGVPEQARASFDDALACSDAIWQELLAKGPAALRHLCLSNRSMVLERLGRLDEAWEDLRASDRETKLLTADGSPLDADREQTVRMQRARLLGRSGRYEPAIREIEGAIACAHAAAQPTWLPDLYGTASDIAQQAGQLGTALQWARRQHQAQMDMQRARSASLQAVLAAEMNVEDVQSALSSSRTQVNELLKENAELRRRLRRLPQAVSTSPETGLADAETFDTVFASLHEHAVARQLPMCLGLLSWTNASALRSQHAPQVLQGVQRQAVELLSTLADVMQPIVAVADGRMALHIRNAGPIRAAATGCDIVALLDRQPWASIQVGLQPRWRCDTADAPAHHTVGACLQALVAASGADRHPLDAKAGAA